MSKKHALIMIACCLVPIAGFVLVSTFNIPLKSVFYFGMILICPLLHLLMMKSMGHGGRNEFRDHQHRDTVNHAHHHDVPHISNPRESLD